MKKALFYGVAASFFFAFTFIFNRSMNLSGGYWMWSAALRYIFTLPMLWLLVKKQRGVSAVLGAIKDRPGPWILWSTVGFGLFYLPLTWASVYGESWFVAASWQFTIVAGILTTPLFGKKIPVKNMIFALVILGGIFLMQASHFKTVQTKGMLSASILIVIAAFSYPLGNRKMMACCPAELTTIQRVFGMTVCSMPFWLVTAAVAAITHGAPSGGQAAQSFVVALFSGVVATLLFFEATRLTKHDPKQLAVIEATQSGEVLFTLLGGILFLGDQMPSLTGWIGIALIVAGMICNSLASAYGK
jgi:drug/metabolite transporter (DMT)-like permease